jgi:hypothetical protein
MKVKVGGLIPGQARFYNHNDLLDVLKKYDADVFMHTWDKVDYYKSPYSTVEVSISNEDVKSYIDLYKPKKYLIEQNLTDEFIYEIIGDKVVEKCSSPITRYNMYRYFYSLNKAWKLIENIEEYDFLIISRSDMVNITLPDLNFLDKNAIYTSYVICDNRFGDNNHCYMDLNLMIIPPKYMDTYVGFLDKMDEYYDKGYHYGWDEMFFAHMKESRLFENTNFLNKNEFYFELLRDKNGIKPKHILM